MWSDEDTYEILKKGTEKLVAWNGSIQMLESCSGNHHVETKDTEQKLEELCTTVLYIVGLHSPCIIEDLLDIKHPPEASCMLSGRSVTVMGPLKASLRYGIKSCTSCQLAGLKRTRWPPFNCSNQ